MISTSCPEFVCSSWRDWQLFSIINPLSMFQCQNHECVLHITFQSDVLLAHLQIHLIKPSCVMKRIYKTNRFRANFSPWHRPVQVGQFTGITQRRAKLVHKLCCWVSKLYFIAKLFLLFSFVFIGTKPWDLCYSYKLAGRLCNIKVLTLLKHAFVASDHFMLFPLRMMVLSSVK